MDDRDERRFRALMENAVEGATLLDVTGKVVLLVPATARIVGYTVEEFLGMNAFELLHPDDIQRATQLFSDLAAHPGKVLTAEIRYRHRQGHYLWLEATGRNLLHEPDIQGMVINFRDVTERHEREQALLDSEQRYRTLVEHAPEAIVVLDVDQGSFIDANQKACDLFQCTREELLKLNPIELSPTLQPDGRSSADGVFENVQLALDGQIPVFEWMHRSRPGQIIPCEIYLVRLPSTKGRLVRGSMIDISERKRQEERQRRLEAEQLALTQRLQRILDQMPLGCLVADSQERFLYWNPAAEAIFGWTSEEILGHHPFENVTPPEAHSYVRDIFDQLARGTPAIFANGINRTRDGRTIDCEWSNVGLRDADGSFLGILSMCQDITQRRKAEQQLLDSLHEKEVLLKEIHHRVKNNLQIVSSLLSLQAGAIKDPQVLLMFQESERRVRAMALIHEFLYRSASMAQIEFAPHVARLCEYLKHSFGIDPGRIALEVEIADIHLPLDLAVPCSLILNEVISNALTHGFPNGRSGRVWVRLVGEPDGSMLLEIGDDGVGMPGQQEQAQKDSLGLHLVTALVKQIAGKLEVVHQGGTLFRIRFRA